MSNKVKMSLNGFSMVANLPENFTLSTSWKWENLAEKFATQVAWVGALAEMEGASAIFQQSTYFVWVGAEPFEVNLDLEFVAMNDPKYCIKVAKQLFHRGIVTGKQNMYSAEIGRAHV